ncbi:helix-turn-helix domain-containing protein [Leptolyngbya sp. KIOST-1]|uniref:helix-turn-helix domain-containing protein n=1 Tax=Leptolyngbya sp. KIOST-1 TaxID=1229172 RepID=UPI0009DDD6C0|nr:helix-turn-helix transcriptional regulator [Leptolyngbya sp. KIOST-1]
MPIRWKLHEVMARKRMRNKDLAEYLDITENSVYRLRKADDMPRLTPQRLEGICAALQCQPGELLVWVPEEVPLPGSVLSQDVAPPVGESVPYSSVIVQQSQLDQRNISKLALQRLTQHYQTILALAWRGYMEYGPGAVVFTDLDDGPKLAFIERQNLTDRNCLDAIDQLDPKLSAVVLYYETLDYTSSDYDLLTLTGPKSPPECFALSYRP